MLGAIIGDMVGSAYEHAKPPVKSTDFVFFTHRSHFTDDTVLTCAVAEAILYQLDYGETIQRYARAYPHRGYGGMFKRWIYSDPAQPYNSFGNGSAMRASPVGFAFSSVEEVLREAEATALPTHNHPEGIKGAQATALAVYLARSGVDKAEIKQEIVTRIGYDLNRTLEEIRPTYTFDVTCQGSVPEAIIAFLESNDFEDAISLAVSLGGDADTIACITGGIAQAYYNDIPGWIQQTVMRLLPPELINLLHKFNERFEITI